MKCALRAVTLVLVLIARVADSSAQSSSGTPSSQAVLEEAKRLNELAEKLYGESKFAEAVVPAERALALREKVLGPSHPAVAESLNNVAVLYQAQAMYDKARASEASDVARLVDDVIASFRKAFDDGRVRVDSASDLDRLIRLKELLGGRADSRGELHGQLSLEAIQGRHRRLRDQVDAMTPELMGTAPQLVDNDARAHGENDGTARELARTSHVAGEPDVPGELGEEERGDGAAH
jgi:hypothetical protein